MGEGNGRVKLPPAVMISLATLLFVAGGSWATNTARLSSQDRRLTKIEAKLDTVSISLAVRRATEVQKWELDSFHNEYSLKHEELVQKVDRLLVDNQRISLENADLHGQVRQLQGEIAELRTSRFKAR